MRSEGLGDLSLGRQGMVGHQNLLLRGDQPFNSLGRQGMVGHQNLLLRGDQPFNSLGRQGMVGHQNYSVDRDVTP